MAMTRVRHPVPVHAAVAEVNSHRCRVPRGPERRTCTDAELRRIGNCAVVRMRRSVSPDSGVLPAPRECNGVRAVVLLTLLLHRLYQLRNGGHAELLLEHNRQPRRGSPDVGGHEGPDGATPLNDRKDDVAPRHFHQARVAQALIE